MSRRTRRKATAYEIRANVLKYLGFKSYGEYLISDLWKHIRRRVLERDGFKCRMCQKSASQVHHKSYRVHTMQGKNLANLISLCGPCHESIEFDDSGNKVTLGEANLKAESIIVGVGLNRYCPTCITCGKAMTKKIRKPTGKSKCRACVKAEHNRFIKYCRRG